MKGMFEKCYVFHNLFTTKKILTLFGVIVGRLSHDQVSTMALLSLLYNCMV